jgi:hypothetical protein
MGEANWAQRSSRRRQAREAGPASEQETELGSGRPGEPPPRRIRWPTTRPRLTEQPKQSPVDPADLRRTPERAAHGGFRRPPADPAGRSVPGPLARGAARPPRARLPRPLPARPPDHLLPPHPAPRPGPAHDALREPPASRDLAAPGGLTPGGPMPGELTPGELTPGELTPGELTPGEPTPGEPMAERPVLPSPGGRDRRRSLPRPRARSLTVVVIVIMLLVAGGVKLALFLRGGRGTTVGSAAASQNTLTTAVAARQAAQWVSQQVGHNVIVACDPVMCSALKGQGLSAANLLVLRNAGPDLLHAGVVVVTPIVRDQFGKRMTSVYAPAVIAGFGSGTARVNVQVTAPDGSAAYLAALRQDVTARKTAGIQLLVNKRIGATARARAQLAAGDVDSRLLLMLPALAAIHPVEILAFGDPGPQASQGIPLCSADLSVSGPPAGTTEASYLSSQVAFVRAQSPPFSGSAAVLQQGSERILRVQFSRPSPLGLLGRG